MDGDSLVIVSALLLGLACATPPGHISVAECQAFCDDAVAGGCLRPSDCECSPDEVDVANRCSDVSGCGDQVEAFHACISGGSICDLSCESEARSAGSCRATFCTANPYDSCCRGLPPPAPEALDLDRLVDMTVEGVLESSGPMWWDTPLLHEVALECPLATSYRLASPHRAFAVHAYRNPISLTLTLDNPGGGSSSVLMAVYAGDGVPDSLEAATDCLAVHAASGAFLGEIVALPIGYLETATVVVWSYPVGLPQSFRLRFRTE